MKRARLGLVLDSVSFETILDQSSKHDVCGLYVCIFGFVHTLAPFGAHSNTHSSKLKKIKKGAIENSESNLSKRSLTTMFEFVRANHIDFKLFDAYSREMCVCALLSYAKNKICYAQIFKGNG